MAAVWSLLANGTWPQAGSLPRRWLVGVLPGQHWGGLAFSSERCSARGVQTGQLPRQQLLLMIALALLLYPWVPLSSRLMVVLLERVLCLLRGKWLDCISIFPPDPVSTLKLRKQWPRQPLLRWVHLEIKTHFPVEAMSILPIPHNPQCM